MRQQEKESIIVYAYRWDRALVRSSGIHTEDEKHPHVIKDFIALLQHNIRNKIANKWADLENLPHTVQEAFDLAIKTETQIQVADSFKMELNINFTSMDINEISTDDTSSDEFEVNEVSRGKRWNNNENKKNGNISIEISAAKPDTTTKMMKTSHVINGKPRKRMQKLPSCRNHHISFLQNLGESFFRQFDIAMKLKKDELKNQGKITTEVSGIMENDMINAFGVTKDNIMKVAEILGKEEKTKILRNSSA